MRVEARQAQALVAQQVLLAQMAVAQALLTVEEVLLQVAQVVPAQPIQAAVAAAPVEQQLRIIGEALAVRVLS